MTPTSRESVIQTKYISYFYATPEQRLCLSFTRYERDSFQEAVEKDINPWTIEIIVLGNNMSPTSRESVIQTKYISYFYGTPEQRLCLPFTGYERGYFQEAVEKDITVNPWITGIIFCDNKTKRNHNNIRDKIDDSSDDSCNQ